MVCHTLARCLQDIFGAFTKLKSAANGFPKTSKVLLGIAGALTKLRSAPNGVLPIH